MSSTLDLIKMTPTEAIYKMAQEALDNNPYTKGLNAKWYKPLLPEVIEYTLTRVVFSLDKLSAPIDKWDSLSSFIITYNRLDLNKFTLANELKTTFPSTSVDILKSYLDTLGIVSEDRDFLERESISSPGTYKIYTDSNSYRFINGSTIIVSEYIRSIKDLINRDNVVTDFSEDYSSLKIRDDIIDHLNIINDGRTRRKLNKGDVLIGVPLRNGPNKSATNTKIKLEGITGDFKDSEYIYYRRRTFDNTWGYPLEYIYRQEWLTYSDMLDTLSDTLKCRIVDSDIINEAVTKPLRNRPVTFTINFNEESLAYVGGITITLKER